MLCQLTTTAKKIAIEKYVINGTKRYITNAPIAGVFSVMAKTRPEKKSSSISCFLVDAKTSGCNNWQSQMLKWAKEVP